MKYYIVLIALLVACQNPKPTDSSELTADEIQAAKGLIQGVFDDIWAAADSTKLLDYHTEDFVILEQGLVWNNDSVMQYMRDRLSRENNAKRVNEMDYISLEKYGESIQIAYYNHAEFTRADTLVGKAKWLESALAVKTKAGWRLKMMHSTWAGNR